MNGQTHRAIGTVVGVAMVLYGVQTNEPLYALGMATAPLGAMLPDIDHDKTKLGRARKMTEHIINTVTLIIFVASIILTVLVGFIDGTLLPLLFKSLIYIVPPCAIVVMVNSPKMRTKYHFFHKHRGIMHTLAVPVCLCVGAVMIDNTFLNPLILGLALGYLSHLFADCMTVSGCPLGWPIFEDSVRIMRIRTGTVWEYVGAAFLSVGILGYSLKLVNNPEAIYWLVIPLMYGFGVAMPKMMWWLMPKKYKHVADAILLPIGFIALAFLLRDSGIVGYVFLGLGIGGLAGKIQSRTGFNLNLRKKRRQRDEFI